MKITHYSAILTILMAMSSLAMHIIAYEYIKPLSPEFIKQQRQPFLKYDDNLESDIKDGKRLLKWVPGGSYIVQKMSDNSKYTQLKDMQVMDESFNNKEYLNENFDALSTEENLKDLNAIFKHLNAVREYKKGIHKDDLIEALENTNKRHLNLPSETTHDDMLNIFIDMAKTNKSLYLKRMTFVKFALYLFDKSKELNIDLLNSQFEIPSQKQAESPTASPRSQ